METRLSEPLLLSPNRSNQSVKHRAPHLAIIGSENKLVDVLLSVVLADVDMSATEA